MPQPFPQDNEQRSLYNIATALVATGHPDANPDDCIQRLCYYIALDIQGLAGRVLGLEEQLEALTEIVTEHIDDTEIHVSPEDRARWDGMTTAYVFDNVDDMNASLADPEFVAKLQVGNLLLIRAVDQPDYWWDGTQALVMDGKTDLTDYYTKEETDSFLVQKANLTGGNTFHGPQQIWGLFALQCEQPEIAGAISAYSAAVGFAYPDTECHLAATDPDGFVYFQTTLSNNRNIGIWDPETRTVSTVPTEGDISGIFYDPVSGRVFVGTSVDILVRAEGSKTDFIPSGAKFKSMSTMQSREGDGVYFGSGTTVGTTSYSRGILRFALDTGLYSMTDAPVAAIFSCSCVRGDGVIYFAANNGNKSKGLWYLSSPGSFVNIPLALTNIFGMAAVGGNGLFIANDVNGLAFLDSANVLHDTAISRPLIEGGCAWLFGDGNKAFAFAYPRYSPPQRGPLYLLEAGGAVTETPYTVRAKGNAPFAYERSPYDGTVSFIACPDESGQQYLYRGDFASGFFRFEKLNFPVNYPQIGAITSAPDGAITVTPNGAGYGSLAGAVYRYQEASDPVFALSLDPCSGEVIGSPKMQSGFLAFLGLQNISSDLAAEVTRATAAETALNNSINESVSSLDTRITNVKSSLTYEVTRATAAEKALGERITGLTSDQIKNVSGVDGETVSAALETLKGLSGGYQVKGEQSGRNSTATGKFSRATEDSATATGFNAQATRPAATATGNGATASGDFATATGGGATATGSGATATGSGAQAEAAWATATGNGATATATGAIAVGQGAQALHERSTAIGMLAITAREDEVSFGAPEQTCLLANVSDGLLPTDAVTLRQLTASIPPLEPLFRVSDLDAANIYTAGGVVKFGTGAELIPPDSENTSSDFDAIQTSPTSLTVTLDQFFAGNQTLGSWNTLTKAPKKGAKVTLTAGGAVDIQFTSADESQASSQYRLDASTPVCTAPFDCYQIVIFSVTAPAATLTIANADYSQVTVGSLLNIAGKGVLRVAESTGASITGTVFIKDFTTPAAVNDGGFIVSLA